MTREQVNHRNSEDLSSVFDRASFFRLASLFFPSMLAVFTVGIFLAFVFGKKFQVLVPIVLVTMVFGAWLDNFVNPSTRLHELAPTEN